MVLYMFYQFLSQFIISTVKISGLNNICVDTSNVPRERYNTISIKSANSHL